MIPLILPIYPWFFAPKHRIPIHCVSFGVVGQRENNFFYPFRRISEMENLGELDGLREQNNGDLVSSPM